MIAGESQVIRRYRRSPPVRRDGPRVAVRADRHGFTLVEVLLVATIILIVVALTLSAMTRPVASRRLAIGAEQVRAAWSRARNRAMASGTPFRFRCLLESDQFIIEYVPADEASTTIDATAWSGETVDTEGGLPPIFRTVQHLPEDVVFAEVEVDWTAQSDAYTTDETSLVNTTVTDSALGLAWEEPEPGEPALGTEAQPILFYPDGTATAARVVLKNRYGQAIELSLRGLTGTAVVSDMFRLEGESQQGVY
ncbi:MAG: prepilin-type N-terminal cleavage/methylation domain-containing protein [Planctomycetota bacterium]|nr:MAG: prepilin-type N-terminal cleavage/methylation domain-containing protein [Planctomycetota bacterium]